MQRDRGRCAGGANVCLGGEIIACVAMLEDPGDERRVSDRGDDPNCSATARTAAEVDREHRGAERCIQLIGAVGLDAMVSPVAADVGILAVSLSATDDNPVRNHYHAPMHADRPSIPSGRIHFKIGCLRC